MNLDSNTHLPSHPFWEFSLAIYRHETIKQGCLSLQDRLAMNVNVLLFAFWLAKTGRGYLHQADVEKIHYKLRDWHRGITGGLRNIRYVLEANLHHPSSKYLHKIFLEHELVAEHIEQLLLNETVTRIASKQLATPDKLKDSINSIANYAYFMHILLTPQDIDNIIKILVIIFPEVDETIIKHMCKRLNPALLKHHY